MIAELLARGGVVANKNVQKPYRKYAGAGNQVSDFASRRWRDLLHHDYGHPVRVGASQTRAGLARAVGEADRPRLRWVRVA